MLLNAQFVGNAKVLKSAMFNLIAQMKRHGQKDLLIIGKTGVRSDPCPVRQKRDCVNNPLEDSFL